MIAITTEQFDSILPEGLRIKTLHRRLIREMIDKEYEDVYEYRTQKRKLTEIAYKFYDKLGNPYKAMNKAVEYYKKEFGKQGYNRLYFDDDINARNAYCSFIELEDAIEDLRVVPYQILKNDRGYDPDENILESIHRALYDIKERYQKIGGYWTCQHRLVNYLKNLSSKYSNTKAIDNAFWYPQIKSYIEHIRPNYVTPDEFIKHNWRLIV